MERKLEILAIMSALVAELTDILTAVPAPIPNFSNFKETTARLLTALWNAPKKMLSHEDIREDVIWDGEASNKAVERVVARGREELREHQCSFEIVNVYRKGFRLVAISLQNPQNPQSICEILEKQD